MSLTSEQAELSSRIFDRVSLTKSYADEFNKIKKFRNSFDRMAFVDFVVDEHLNNETGRVGITIKARKKYGFSVLLMMQLAFLVFKVIKILIELRRENVT